jgi:preprotein translocase subunit SecF
VENERVINFLKFRYLAFGISIGLAILFIAASYFKGGYVLGIDFLGGVKVIARFDTGVDSAKIRNAFSGSNISAQIQQVGEEEHNEYIITTKLLVKEESAEKSFEIIRNVLLKEFPTVNIVSTETVGPAVGDLMKKTAIYSMIMALVLMIVYLTFRFEFKFSIGVLIAVLHDVILCALFCGIAGIEMSTSVVAAILTIFGFSVNDTIVIFDRVRENMQVKSKQTFIEIINKSITQTLSRTFITSITVFFTVLALYIFGGEVLRDFALVLLFGLIVGTYSTIYIASPVVITWERLT